MPPLIFFHLFALPVMFFPPSSSSPFLFSSSSYFLFLFSVSLSRNALSGMPNNYTAVMSTKSSLLSSSSSRSFSSMCPNFRRFRHRHGSCCHCPLVPRIGRGEPQYCCHPCTYNYVLIFTSYFPRFCTFPSGRQDRLHCHCRCLMEEGSGCPWQP